MPRTPALGRQSEADSGACQPASLAKSVHYRSGERPSPKGRWRVVSKDICCWFLPLHYVHTQEHIPHTQVHIYSLNFRHIVFDMVTVICIIHLDFFILTTANIDLLFHPLPPVTMAPLWFCLLNFFSYKILHYVRSSGKCKSKPPWTVTSHLWKWLSLNSEGIRSLTSLWREENPCTLNVGM